MKRKTTLLIILLVIVALIGGFFYVFFTDSQGTAATRLKSLLPFGQNTIPTGITGGLDGEEGDTDLDYTSNNEFSAVPPFRKVTDGPVAGFTLFNRQRTEIIDGKKVVINETPIRYIESGTGNVFETKTTSMKIDRLTNTTYPRIQEAFFTNNGNSLVLRTIGSLDEIRTYLANIVLPQNIASTTDIVEPGSLEGFYIDDDISFVEVSPDTTKIMLVTENTSGASISISDTKGSTGEPIYTSRLSEWLVQWFNQDSIALTSKPSATAPGLIQAYNTKTRTSTGLVSNVAGITGLVNTLGDKVLFSQSSGRTFAFNVYDKKTNTTTNLGDPTFPEKCVWSKKETTTIYCLIPKSITGGSYPDDWYQGSVAFSDEIWKIDITDASHPIFLYDPGVEIDGVRPTLSPNEDYLLFTNKKDGSLWSLNLN